MKKTNRKMRLDVPKTQIKIFRKLNKISEGVFICRQAPSTSPPGTTTSVRHGSLTTSGGGNFGRARTRDHFPPPP